jgi:CRP-like cAMP-binding protein
MEELARDSHHLLFNYIDCAPVFKKLTLFQKRSLAAHMHEVKFEKDAIIFQVGDFANCIYLIKSGEIEVTVPNRSPVVLKSGDIFGEGSLKTHSIRRGEAKALTIANCFVISRNKLSLCV